MATLLKQPPQSSGKPLLSILLGSATLLLALATYIFAASGLQTLALMTFFKIYLGVFAAAALALIGVVPLLIGVIAVGVRLGTRPSSPSGS